MIANFERFQDIQKEANHENYSSQSHVEPTNLPRCPKPGPKQSGHVQKVLIFSSYHIQGILALFRTSVIFQNFRNIFC